jgi:hypothetical protein
LQAHYTQEIAASAPLTSKVLVNSRWNKVVNIASTKMMKKIFAVHEFSCPDIAELRDRTIEPTFPGSHSANSE